jgi:hypothetical protein
MQQYLRMDKLAVVRHLQWRVMTPIIKMLMVVQMLKMLV